MNPPRVTAEDYISHLVVDPSEFTATEMARCHPDGSDAPAHDAFTRLLNRLEPDTEPLWKEVEPLLPHSGILVIDDTVLDKPYAQHMGLVSHFWSGKHKRVVKGINLITCLWTDGDALWPCDYRIVDKAQDKRTKNDHFRELLKKAHQRGLKPKYIGMDSWYASNDNLKHIHELGWKFLTQVKPNRQVNPDDTGNRCISDCEISQTGTIVHLKGFGFVKAFRIVNKDGHTEHWITNDLEMSELTRLSVAEQAWGIEEYHRGLKQHAGVEACQNRMAKAQRNHIGFSIRAFLKLEWLRFSKGINWASGKRSFIREAIRLAIAKLTWDFPESLSDVDFYEPATA